MPRTPPQREGWRNRHEMGPYAAEHAICRRLRLAALAGARETEGELRAYRDRQGFLRSWFYAPDTDRMIWKYGVRSLDTKFLLDPGGVIRWVDVYPAGYDTWRRALGTVGVGR